MGGNPLLLAFLGIGLLLLVLLGVLAVLQRRMFRDQARQVEELLREARQIRMQEGPGGGEDLVEDGEGDRGAGA